MEVSSIDARRHDGNVKHRLRERGSTRGEPEAVSGLESSSEEEARAFPNVGEVIPVTIILVYKQRR